MMYGKVVGVGKNITVFLVGALKHLGMTRYSYCLSGPLLPVHVYTCSRYVLLGLLQ